MRGLEVASCGLDSADGFPPVKPTGQWVREAPSSGTSTAKAARCPVGSGQRALRGRIDVAEGHVPDGVTRHETAGVQRLPVDAVGRAQEALFFISVPEIGDRDVGTGDGTEDNRSLDPR